MHRKIIIIFLEFWHYLFIIISDIYTKVPEKFSNGIGGLFIWGYWKWKICKHYQKIQRTLFYRNNWFLQLWI